MESRLEESDAFGKKIKSSLALWKSSFLHLFDLFFKCSHPLPRLHEKPVGLGEKGTGFLLSPVAEGHLTQDVDVRVCHIAAGRSLLVEGDSRLCAPVTASDKALRD